MAAQSPEVKLPTSRTVANSHPLNLAAARMLPPGWGDSKGTLHVLALMRWHLQAKGVEGGRVTQEALEARVNQLDRDDPTEAMEYLLTSDSGDLVMAALPQDPEAAAMALLQVLADKMVATAP
jgi:hypothetical protein